MGLLPQLPRQLCPSGPMPYVNLRPADPIMARRSTKLTCPLFQHALPVVLTQPPIDLHRKKDEVLCLATAAAPSYERDISKEQIS